jgi:hypothetical protein
MRRALALAVLLTLVGASAGASAATTKSGAVSAVTRILERNERSCDLSWRSVSARRVGSAWRVSARVATSGNPGTASWWVQVGSGRITAAGPLAAEILAGCP